MITNVLYKKRENNKDYFFNYENPNEKDQALRFGNRMAIDAIEWNYKNKKYEICFLKKEFGDVLIEKDKIFIQYQTAEASFPAPNNIVIYTPTAEIEKVLTTPILPNGKKGGGFLQINKIISNKNNFIREFENHLNLIFNIDHAFKTSQNNNPLPYTKTGMTGSKTNIIPEYVNQNDIIFKGGKTMTVYDNKGNIVLRYEYIGFDENNKVLVNKWIKK